ncbi:hypothetical protein HGRIS_001037 [Hohenbuehelia grisea]|uniref:Uncharacterized protein n=1 Tax=Hohenbuehelia grisea TaxID=104357 RepID=A0ABR3JPB9_9AGAR
MTMLKLQELEKRRLAFIDHSKVPEEANAAGDPIEKAKILLKSRCRCVFYVLSRSLPSAFLLFTLHHRSVDSDVLPHSSGIDRTSSS